MSLKKSDWSVQELRDALQSNMHLFMTHLSTDVPVMELFSEPDVDAVRSKIKSDSYNHVVGTKFTEENVEKRVKYVLSIYENGKIPFLWCVSETDTPANLGDVLVNQGLHIHEEELGMYCDLTEFKREKGQLRIERILDPAQIEDFAKVVVGIWEEKEAYDQYYSKIPTKKYAEGAPMEIYVGYLNGQPVISGVLVLHADVAGIYYVATVPEQRKKGFGVEMMTFLMERAKNKGYTISILQATSEGKNLYVRLGFREICKFWEYGF